MINLVSFALLFVVVMTTHSFSRDQLDPSEPNDAMLANNKLFCDNKPETPSIYWWQGVVYSRVPGEKDQHLFNVQGMNTRQCARFEDPVKGIGFRSVSREVMFYLDPKTNEILRTWDNPFTGEAIEVMHVANDPVNSRAPSFARNAEGEAVAKFDASAAIDGRMLSGGGAAKLFYTNPLAGDYQDYEGGKYHASEFLTIAYGVDDALDATKTAIQDAVISWGRISGWLPWMKMGGREGLLVHYTHGMRLHDWQELPEVIRTEIQQNYPDYRRPPPVTDDRPNETTWTKFKKLIDAQRAAEISKK